MKEVATLKINNQLINQFLSESSWAPRTADIYRGLLKIFVEEVGDSFERTDVEKFYKKISKELNRKKFMTTKSVIEKYIAWCEKISENKEPVFAGVEELKQEMKQAREDIEEIYYSNKKQCARVGKFFVMQVYGSCADEILLTQDAGLATPVSNLTLQKLTSLVNAERCFIEDKQVVTKG